MALAGLNDKKNWQLKISMDCPFKYSRIVIQWPTIRSQSVIVLKTFKNNKNIPLLINDSMNWQVGEGEERSLAEQKSGERSLAGQETVSLNLPLDLNLLVIIFTTTVVSVLLFCLVIVFVMIKLSQRHAKELLTKNLLFLPQEFVLKGAFYISSLEETCLKLRPQIA